MGPNGTITLPEPHAAFFAEGELVDVVEYRWH